MKGGRFGPTPIRANRVGEILRKMFNLAIRWQIRSDNPAAGFSRFPEIPRDRFLSADEIKRLADVLAEHPNRRCTNVIRLLLLMGARRGEAMNARWDQFDLENGIWTKPAATTKQRRLHRMPLSQAAVELRPALCALRLVAARDWHSRCTYISRIQQSFGPVADEWSV